MTTATETQPIAHAEADSFPRCAVSTGSAYGAESSPVWRGSFDFYRDRGPYQVRIHIWGWPAKLLWRIMSPRWITRGYTPTPEGEVIPLNGASEPRATDSASKGDVARVGL